MIEQMIVFTLSITEQWTKSNKESGISKEYLNVFNFKNFETFQGPCKRVRFRTTDSSDTIKNIKAQKSKLIIYLGSYFQNFIIHPV